MNNPNSIRKTFNVTKSRRYWHPITLLLIILVAAIFRFSDTNWDEGRLLHPDERYIAVLAGQLRPPPDLKGYFDSGKSTLNPYNTDWGRSYVYGTLPLFIPRYIGVFLDSGCGTLQGSKPAAIPALLNLALFGPEVNKCVPGSITFFDKLVIIGRTWSGFADLISVFILYLIGRRLFGWRVGLVAAALCAFAVMQIQASHFFTVDSTANLFVTITLYFCALMVSDQARWHSAGMMRWGISEFRFALFAFCAGISAGCGIASKISVWPLVPLIVLAVFVALIRDRRLGIVPLLSGLIALIIAGVGTFSAFRVAQPYAFVGNSVSEFTLTLQQCSSFDDTSALSKVCAIGAKLPTIIREVIAPSSRWIEQLTLAQALMDGSNSPPFAHQWANRTPLIFPLVNLIFWGMGIPLGLAACTGLLFSLWRLLRRRRWSAYVIPVVWGGLYFVYQSTQWTKSMRYLLPIYPTLCLCSAIVLVALWRNSAAWIAHLDKYSTKSIKSILVRFGPAVIIGTVLVGNLIWATAFSQIYTEPVTRISASRWVFDNIPTAVTLRWLESDGTSNHMELPITKLNLKPGAFQSVPFHVDLVNARMITNLQVEFNHLSGDGLLSVHLTTPDGVTLLQTGHLQVDQNHTVVPVGTFTLLTKEEYALTFQLESGSGITARTSVVANEHWDDAVPQPIDGKDPYGNYYTGLKSSSDGQIQNYAEDTPDKQPNVMNWLDEADYLVMSSNRLYGAIPRLPWRFPMTTEYYRALFNGELGFELVADFNSFTRLGPFVFNDQEMAQPLRRTATTAGTPAGIQVPYPYAEEAFSVYDHPRVLIFKKTSAYSRSLAQQVLGKYDLTRTIQQTPLAAINTPRGMLFDDTTRAAQQAGGTWSEIYRLDSLLNQSQPLAVIAWIVLIEILGMVAFPIIALSTARRNGDERSHPLLDGGYSYAKAFSLLLVAFIAWWLSSTKIAQYTALEIWAIIVGIVVVGLVLFIRNQATMLQIIKNRMPIILASELVFLLAFGIFLFIRYANPDLWHPYMGGEKPMDFAYLNAVLKSSYFPPIDPWFSGGYINYYYFGFVFVSTPIKALGIDPSIAYNLVIPTLFGMTSAGAYGIGATLYSRLNSRSSYKTESQLRVRRAIVAGVLAAFFVCLLGNLREIDVLASAWQQLGGVKAGTAPIPATIDGFGKWISGAQLPIYPNWPYWNPTRPTAGTAVDSVQIAEFPLFTFLYADLHAHMMAMPLAFLALAFALAFAGGAHRKWPAVIFGAMVIGSLWPTNTWDYPVYLIVCLGAMLVSTLEEMGSQITFTRALKQIAQILPIVIIFLILTRAFYIPYIENYGSAYNSVEPWTAERTPLDVYLTIYGLFLLPIVAFIGLGIWRNLFVSTRRGVAGWVLALLSFAVGIFMALRGVQIAVVVVPLSVIAFIAAIMPGTPAQTRMLWLLTSGALLLTLFVEYFTLKGDIGRMNTLFKFYIQAWLILGVSSAVLLMWVFDRIDELRTQSAQIARIAGMVIRPAFIVATAILVFLAILYPLAAIPSKISDRYVNSAPKGLDGMAYMSTAMRTEGKQNQVSDFPLLDDMLAIRWMQANVKGSPTIIEGTTGGDLYRWGNRFSIYTGLPAVVGWQWHERQQRAAINDRIIYDRDADLETFYGTTDVEQALVIIRRYHAKYIILGALEKSYYNPAGLAKFDELVQNGFIKITYQNSGTTIFEVYSDTVPLASGEPGTLEAQKPPN